MIHSMTALARETDESPAGSLAVEIRSVNHRGLDCVFRLPQQMQGLEPEWRELLAASLTRGKLDCQLHWRAAPASASLAVDRERLEQLAAARDEVESIFGKCGAPDPLALLQWPGVLETAGGDEDEIGRRATELFRRALDGIRANRAREGEKLAGFIGDRLDKVTAAVENARRLMPELIARQRERLEQRLAEVTRELDPQRLEQEMALLAQKTDVEEELDRLRTHVEEVRRVLAGGGPCGRRLDFLMQELNREANTLAAKSISGSGTKNAVELKVLVEQMREQIQNLE